MTSTARSTWWPPTISKSARCARPITAWSTRSIFISGRIIEHLKATGQYDRTLIIVTSDHAEMLGEHYVWGKEIYFDQSFHVPLVIRDPRPAADNTRGRRVDQLTQAIDVMPTVLDWLGLKVPRACDGASLMPFLRGDAPAGWRDAVFFEQDFRDVRTQAVETALGISSDQCCYAAIRDEHFKYVHFAALPPLLFDLDSRSARNAKPRAGPGLRTGHAELRAEDAGLAAVVPRSGR